MKQAELQGLLQNPPAEYRSAPFWSWNGKLEQSRLDEQLRGFAAAGAGGFFMHSREGLETAYLSGAWLQAIVASAKTGKKLGLRPFIYDEDKWPSGMAGGQVAASDPALRACAITLAPDRGDCRFSFAARLEQGSLKGVRPGGELQPGERLLGMEIEYSGPSDWYSGSAPSDNLNPQSVGKFLELTHQRYQEAFSHRLSDFVEGFFTDEPNFCDFFAAFTPGQPWLPWTQALPEYFRRRRGYDLLPELPYLFYKGEKSPQIRHDYWQTLTELFDESYFQQIHAWCAENGVKLCGHLLFENGLGYQARVCGAAMPHYRWFDMPGIDILGERTEEYLTLRQCTSVGHQYAKPVVSETYGCSGWQFGFEGQKRIWDWQAVMGVSLRCQHLSQYTIKGLRKRDYPPFFGPQSEWWQYDRAMEDYCARLSVLARSGQVCRDILLIHPQSSVWTKCGSAETEDLSHFDGNMGWTDAHIYRLNAEYDRLNRLAKALLLSQCDFDFGDEMLLAEDGRVEKGTLCLGQGRYRLIVVPWVCSLFASTCLLLAQFEADGGRVVWLGGLPSMIQGRPDSLASRLFPRAEIVPDAAGALAAAMTYRQVQITDLETLQPAPILTSLHKLDGGFSLMAVNPDHEKSHSCRIRLPACGAVTRFDPLSGGKTPVSTNEQMEFDACLSQSDCKIYLLDTTRPMRCAPLALPYRDVHETIPTAACLGPCAEFRRTMPNALTLDLCRYRTAGEWSGEMDLWRAQREIRAAAGFRQIFGSGQAMRYTWIGEQKPSVPLSLRFVFTVRDLPDGPLHLALEEAGRMEVRCNGAVCSRADGYFLDPAIRLVELENVQPGENQLLLRCEYTHEMELEDLYLLGNFALAADRALVREPKTLRFGDWCLQGYPNYPGSMVYRFSFRAQAGRLSLRLPEWSGTLLSVRVNGGAEQVVLWRGQEALSLQVSAGENRMEIKVVGGNRNLFGPLHQPNLRNSRIDWRDFRTEGGAYSSDQVLQPCGLLGQIYLE